MKLYYLKTSLFACFIFCVLQNFAQSPNGFKYQTIVRNVSGAHIQNQLVTIKINILSGSASGTIVYSESHKVTTSNFGLVNLDIGTGTILSGNLANINWSTGTYFIKIEMDATGGTSYLNMGSSQILTVPYSKYADKSGKSLNDFDTSASNEIQNLSFSNDTLTISKGNKIRLTGYVPSNTFVITKSKIPPSGYNYSGNSFVIPPSATIREPMTVQRYCPGIATVNNQIYVIGGRNDTSYALNTNEKYDPATGIWTTLAAMPTNRYGLVLAVLNNKIYAIGGRTGTTTVTGACEEYDPATDSWATKASMPTPRAHLAVGVINNKIYAVAGSKIATYYNTTEEYDPSTDTWTSKANAPTTRSEVVGAVLNGKMYVIGGYNYSSSIYLSTIEEYNPVNNTWATKNNMPTIRSMMTAEVINNKIYVIGGRNASLSSSEIIEGFNPDLNYWTVEQPMTIPRAGVGASIVNGKIYIIGGSQGIILKVNEEYNPVSTNYYIHIKP